MPRFWAHGYGGTSMDDLVRVTGASRQAIYQCYGDKRELYIGCLNLYRDSVVTPAFARVERAGASLTDIAAFFEIQIARAEAGGLPGPGCLFVNTMAEVAPHDPGVEALTAAHDLRLRRGFANALAGSAGGGADGRLIDDLATMMTASAHGLWSMSRAILDAAPLRRAAACLIDLVQRRLPK